jgi:Iap family predicted aminopeptidase
MAKCLVQYIDCAERIHREVSAQYDNAPCVETIRRYRATYNRQMLRSPNQHDASVVWMDERYQNNMDEANRRFVAALHQAGIAA